MFDGIHEFVGNLLFGKEKYERSRYKRAKRIAKRFGFEVYKPHLVWLQDADYLRVKAEVAARKIVGIPNDRCFVLLDLARASGNVAGDIAECGVRYGKSSLFILNGFGEKCAKRYEIFDSFEGLSEPVEADKAENGSAVWETGELAVQEETVLQNLQDFAARIRLHKGWIPDRFNDVKKSRFAFVHVDVDLYQPTLDSFAFFYPRMSKGGVMICDDYGSAYCPGAKRAVDEFFAAKPERVFSLPTGQSLVIKE
jgi:O-methyltransferase